jgi:dipeptidyl aminopeptidase/acylaminoacyl peptidase
MKALFFALLFLALNWSAQGQNANYTIRQYLNIRAASAPNFSPDGRSIAYLSNASGTTQIWTLALGSNSPKQITNYDDNIGFVRWLEDGNILFGKAKGGDENTQFYLMKADGTDVKALTNDPSVRHNFGVVYDGGKKIAYGSNKRNRQYFDIYTMDLSSGQEELQYQFDGNNDVVAVSDSGRKLVISRDGMDLSLDNDLYLIDPKLKTEIPLTPHSGAAEFGNVHFVADGIVFTHNDQREFATLSQLRKTNAATDDWTATNREVRSLDNNLKWDVTDVEMDTYGSKIAYTVNRDGFSELYIRGYETDGKPLITVISKQTEQVRLPGQGIVTGLRFNKDESKLAFSFSSATQNGDIWVYDLKERSLTQITHSDQAGIDKASLVAPRLIRFKTFDGRDIPAWYYLPRMARGAKDSVGTKYKTIVSVHGGPEGQERPGFSGLYQYYLSRGYAILATNVRGSTGYGKTYTHLDDVRKREDSVKDLAYAVEWLKKDGHADPKRIAIMGGSYGGYMTLAAITLYPDLWAAAVDTVGISNWESFLKNTSGYRRRQREVEYGRLDRDIDFLRSISPIAKVDRIKTPLFVIAGRNDPRVPWTEGQQIVDALRKRNSPVEWKVYDDEGHGVSKLKNRIELYPLVADFLDKNIK